MKDLENELLELEQNFDVLLNDFRTLKTKINELIAMLEIDVGMDLEDYDLELVRSIKEQTGYNLRNMS